MGLFGCANERQLATLLEILFISHEHKSALQTASADKTEESRGF